MSLIRYAAGAALLFGLTACGSSGVGGILGGIGGNALQCDTGTQQQLANPQPGQTNVAGNIGQIVIVANGKANTLYSTYNQWNIQLTDNFGNTIQGGPLTLYSYPSGPHPYGSDYYYSSSIQTLSPGTTYTARLIENNGTGCLAVPLNSFST